MITLCPGLRVPKTVEHIPAPFRPHKTDPQKYGVELQQLISVHNCNFTDYRARTNFDLDGRMLQEILPNPRTTKLQYEVLFCLAARILGAILATSRLAPPGAETAFLAAFHKAFNESGRVDLNALFTHALLTRPPAQAPVAPTVTVQRQDATDVKELIRQEMAKNRAQPQKEGKPSHRGKRTHRW
ncbi:MAG: hypothetical protein FJ308_23090 [Planctomycetes bacterium]|nr:hypothetical protein [Planctomycetota bacterium]